MSSKVEEWTVLSMMEWATDFFEKKSIPDPRHSIEWLLAETLGVKRLDLYLKFDRPLSPNELDTLRPMVKRRAQHEPLQYIIGYTDFMNARINVNENVLIPRLETEQLVEIMLDEHKEDTQKNVMDLGTGSGCIPIALKMERPKWTVAGIDISEEALATAEENAENNRVDVHFSKGDILSPESISISERLDLLVSNPPYITPGEKELLEPQVREYEPHRALFFESMETMYGSIIDFGTENLVEGGALYLELHERYADQILSLFDENSWEAAIRKDYDNKPRFIVARLK